MKRGGLGYLKLAFLSMAVAVNAYSQESGVSIDTQRSSITIHVGKSGLFAPAAHEHWVDALIASGTIDAAGATPSVRLTGHAPTPSVRPEQSVTDKDQPAAQANIHT